MLKGVHRRHLGIGNDGQVIAPQGLETGGDGYPTIVYPAPNSVAMFDDFTGKTVTDTWTTVVVDTGQTITPRATVNAAFTNGVLGLKSSATTTDQTPIGGAQSVASVLNWKANQGGLRFSTRLKIATLAGNTVYAGFTDTGGNEMPAYDTGGGILTPASDYFGFICSGEGGATQQAWRAVAGKATVDQSATTGVTPVANTYTTLECEVTQDGNTATFWIDGRPVASIPSAAVTPTVGLAAGIYRANTDAAENFVDVDWINISAHRDTGT
jgi:hypothetical protein